MKNVPNDSQVIQALATTDKRISSLVKKINRQAGTLLARGDYAGSDSLVKLAKIAQEYHAEFVALRLKWRELMHPASKTIKNNKTENLPLWEYYRPILNALIELGGDASRQDILNTLKPRINGIVKSGDMEIMSNGRPRWQVMVARARRPMIKEGFLDPRQKNRWRITPAGRQAAHNSIDGTQ